MGPGTSKEGSLVSTWHVKGHWENFLPSTLFICIYRFDTYFFFLSPLFYSTFVYLVYYYIFLLSLFSFKSSFMRDNLARSQTDCDGATYQYR